MVAALARRLTKRTRKEGFLPMLLPLLNPRRAISSMRKMRRKWPV